jgi:hypothetical protein
MTTLRNDRWVWFIIGCVVFGVLMSVREEIRSLAWRAVMAGFAFVFLGTMLVFVRGARTK